MRTSTSSRTRIVIAAAAGATALALSPTLSAVATPAPTDLETRCVGTAGAVTVPGDLLVPAGETCLLEGTTVEGDVDVRAGANLVADSGATLEGEVLVRRDAYLEVVDGTVHGLTRFSGAYGGYVDGGHLADVEARNSGFYVALSSDQDSHLAVNSESTLESSWVDGDVSANGGVLTDVLDTVITGELSVRNAESGSLVCGSEVDGAAEIRDAAGGSVQLGEGPYAECAGNVFGDDLTLRSNVTELGTHVAGNVVRGTLDCTLNEPAPVGGDNRVRGEASGQCADLQPGAAAEPGTVSAAVRSADTLDRIELRSEQARGIAADLGPAGIGR